MTSPLFAEWLEADGLGGFASGTVGTTRTRRYHAWLLAATTPPTGRFVLVNGGDVWVETSDGPAFLSSQHYASGDAIPAPCPSLLDFTTEPWPTWTFRVTDGSTIRQELVAVHGRPLTALRWTAIEVGRPNALHLSVRPFLSGRDYHALHRENYSFQFEPRCIGAELSWSPYPGVPLVYVASNGTYSHQPAWYRNFVYVEERDRGLDHVEDLAAPGVFQWTLGDASAVLLLSTERLAGSDAKAGDVVRLAESCFDQELRRRRQFASPLHRAADAYVVRRGGGRTLVAGYPWFTDWGRDTFIAMRGLCLAADRLDVAEEILVNWSAHVSDGMLPNRFPDVGASPEFNAVDASLWYVQAISKFLRRCEREGKSLSNDVTGRLLSAVDEILRGYARGTRFGIRMDDDGLIAAGEPGVQLTWMDAKVGDWVVTPRVGKPVEVQALWLNALHAFRQRSAEYEAWFQRGRNAFRKRFWNPAKSCLYDVIDEDHVPNRCSDAVRPNQVFAVGGLPLVLLDSFEARSVVDCVERELWTPWGLRTLSPNEPGYRGQYRGGVRERDAAYHQGTAWPWLMGPFVEAWLRVYGADRRHEAHDRFLRPMEGQLQVYGLGHLAEVADGDAPHQPGGCPFQAWSLGEFLRLKWDVLRSGEPLSS